MTNVAKFVTGLAIASSVQPVYSCDQTLYLKADNRVCTNNNCYDTSTYMLQIMSGNVICFNDNTGNIFRLSMTGLYTRQRYNLMYYTANFTTDVKSIYECGNNGFCSDKSSCRTGYKHHDLIKYEEKWTIKGYGCQNAPAACDSYCFRDSVCTAYLWQIKPSSDVYPIYKLYSTIMETSIKIEYLDKSTEIWFNTNNPQHDIIGTEASDTCKVPITITGFINENKAKDSYLIKYKEKAYYVNACSQNSPCKSLLGDLQISTDQKTLTYDISDVQCHKWLQGYVCCTKFHIK